MAATLAKWAAQVARPWQSEQIGRAPARGRARESPIACAWASPQAVAARQHQQSSKWARARWKAWRRRNGSRVRKHNHGLCIPHSCPAERAANLPTGRFSPARRSGRGLEGGWPCRLRAASAASHHQRPGRPWALRCNLGLPTDNTHIEALLTFMKPPPPHHLDLPILTRFRTIRSLKRCLTMAQYHVRQHRYSSRI